MVEAHPELRRVRGYYKHPDVGSIGHWWCKTVDGEIIDPTAAQFPQGGTYQEWQDGVDFDPIGKCLECGELIWNPGESPYEKDIEQEYVELNPDRDFCCEECRISYVAEFNRSMR